MSSREQKTSKRSKEKAPCFQENRIIESIECSKNGSWLYISQHNQQRKTAGKERPVYKEKDLVKHGRNLPSYLQCDGKSAHTRNRTLDFGVLDWSRLENWKSKSKCAAKTSLSGSTLALEGGSPKLPTSINNRIPQLDEQASNSSQPGSSTRRRLPKGARPKGKAMEVQVSNTVPEQTLASMQTSCSEDHSSEKTGKQVVQTITSLKETSLGDSRKYGSRYLHDSTKRLSEVNIDHDDDHCCNEYEDVLFSLQENKSVSEHLMSDEDCMIFDHDIGNPPFVKERHSSLSKRFSFSLEKMAKSISSKTRSAFPQLSSTHKSLNSGPVMFRSSSSPDLLNYYSKKANGANIVRSIPMRWLVEPILKHKGRHITEKVQQSTDLLYEKSSSVHTILQLKMKNEIPFFKLVTHSSSSILAAAVKKLPSGKDDSSLIYSFYSAHEIKKNGKDWKSQDLTKKGHRFDYKILGHMKISSSYHAEFSGLERDLYVVRESVLYGPDCMEIVELAATVVKTTSKENYGGIGASKSTVVILPGCNNHSLPNSGQPSSLVNRWRSGGVCDCGGWDIGCELGVLSMQDETSEAASASSSDRLELCYQGRNNEHDFSLVQLENGLYSLEYNASISLLQAFSICVAVVTSQKLTHIFQVNHLQDASNFTKPIMTKHQKVKSRSIVHAKKPPV